MKFSNKSIAHLSSALGDSIGHQQISKLFFEFDLEKFDPGNPPTNRHGRALALLKAVQKLPEAEAWQTTIEIADRCVGSYYVTDRLVAALHVDGLEFVEGKLVPTTPGPVSLGPAMSAFEAALAGRGLNVAVKHYRQATDNFTDGNFEAANGQVRSFVEDAVPKLANAAGHNADNPGAAFSQLKNAGKLDEAEFQMMKAFWAGIQDNGPHAGLTSQEEATFRLQTATAIGMYLLHKLTG